HSARLTSVHLHLWDCRDADQQYDSLSDWINYEIFRHQKKSDTTGSENGKLSIEVSRKCPFCLEDAGPHHIATHFRRVAYFSLPQSIGSDDDGLCKAARYPLSGHSE
ncbi:Pc12g01660, partial [Penicillium rubens Wisconsin 54-1255]